MWPNALPVSCCFLRNPVSNIYLSSLRDRKIREPDHAFDTIIIPVFTGELDTNNMQKNELLSEIDRVLKNDGILITTSFAEFPTTDNYFANTLLNLYKNNLISRMLSKSEIKEDFSSIDHMKNDIFDYHGMLIGILWK